MGWFLIVSMLLALASYEAFFTRSLLRYHHAVHQRSFSSPHITKLTMSSRGNTGPSLTNAFSNEQTSAPVILKTKGISKTYTQVPQFQNLDFQILQGQCVGLIGANGAGKSTLLKCLAGREQIDEGQIEIMSAFQALLYVPQDIENIQQRGYDLLFQAGEGSKPEQKKLMHALLQYFLHEHSDALASSGAHKGVSADELASSMDTMTELDGWGLYSDFFEKLDDVNLSVDLLFKPLLQLSGGERKKLSLINALLQQPKLLLLDEPTNHLDIDAIDWLGDVLLNAARTAEMTVVLITHDRYFLEQVCTNIMELEAGQVHMYPGNYNQYLDLKEQRLQAEDLETERMRTKLRREKEWMAKQPRARQAKSKARQSQYYELVELSKGRNADKLTRVTGEMKLDIHDETSRLGNSIAEMRGASYILPATVGSTGTEKEGEEAGPGRVLLDEFSYDFQGKDCIGIVGSNGVGKTTFLNLLATRLPLSSGSIRLGDTVRVGYYSQSGLQLSPEEEQMTLLDFITQVVSENYLEHEKEVFAERRRETHLVAKSAGKESLGRRDRLAGKEPKVTYEIVDYSNSRVNSASSSAKSLDTLARKHLSNFQFPMAKHLDRIWQLSGGEKKRIQLLQVLLSNPNLLILDEPTNDLDLKTLLALEDFLLEQFNGCLVMVSHDTYFLNKIAQHLFVFEGDGLIKDFPGSYYDYLDYRKKQKKLSKSK